MDDNKQKKKPLRIAVYLYIVLILLILTTVATYTWFSLSSTPRVSDLGLYVNAPSGLELSVDPLAEEWKLQLDFSEIMEETPTLRPVTWSENDQRFYAASYGLDGRISHRWEPLTDERNANSDSADGYYIAGTFYARSDERVEVSLTPAVEVQEGLQGAGTYVIGTPVWNSDRILHNNGGNGAELAIRIGILVQKTDRTGQDKEEDPVFYIYEPNCDTHTDGSGGYNATASIDGSGTLVPQDRLILQTTSSWTEANPVQRNAVIRKMGEFTTQTKLFTLESDELARITLYVWLEGQDADCTNEIGHEAQVLASIQFAGDTGGQSGLVPVE